MKEIAQAAAALRRGALAEAERECRAILSRSPRHFAALLLLGQVLARAGREAEALAAYESAANVEPSATLPFTFLATRRFRQAFGAPIPPRRELAEPGRRLQMRSLGRKGRFGNQLLQYAFVRLYAHRHGLVAEVPDWIGRDLFDLDDPFPSADLPTITEHEADLFGSLQGSTGQIFAERNIEGFFCGDTRGWSALRSPFCALFNPGHRVRGLLERALHTLRSNGKTIVGIHLRQSDYGYGRFWVAPSSWYLAWLRRIWPRLERPVLFIASDVAGPHAEFAEFEPWSAGELGVEIPGAEFLLDHHVLRHADHLLISNSSFSFTAAMLNEGAQSLVRPDPNHREMVAFDPWASEVLRDAIVEPEAVAAPERSFIRSRILASDTVVHWGSHCSPWTNFARSVHGSLRILEAERQTSLADILRRRGVRYARLLVLEDTDLIRKFLEDADRVLDQARIDLVLVRSGAVGSTHVAASEWSAIGYGVFRLQENALARVDSGELEGSASYLAVRRDATESVESAPT